MPQAAANGITLEYATHGNPANPPLVLIRGLGTQMIEWPASFIDRFVSAGLYVVAFDNRDVGLSTKLDTDYSMADMANDVIGLLDALDIDRAHVFGISLGGIVAQHLGFSHGDRLRCLFCVMTGSGNPDVPMVSAQNSEKLAASPEGRDAVIAADAHGRAVWGSPAWPQDEATRIAAATRAYDRCFCPEGVTRQRRAAGRDGNRVERLAAVTAPTLVIHGEDDSLVPVAAGRDVADSIPNAAFHAVPGMGHNIVGASGPLIADIAIDFIRNQESG